MELNNDPESDDRLEKFFQVTPDLLCVAGFDGFFKRVNPAVSRTLGYSEDELLSQPLINFIYPEDRLLTTELRERTISENNPLVNFENRYITKSGEIVWLAWTSMPVVSERLVYAIAKNVTAKKTLDLTRNQFLTQLMRANKDLKQLTYTAAHDLRSPVNNLLSLFGLIDTGKINDVETAQYIGLLKDATVNLSRVLNETVDNLLLKNSSNTPLEDLNLNDTLNNVVRSIQSLIRDANTRIEVDFSEAPVVKFNKAFLESIFLNLITNAIKYSRADAPPEITITSYSADGRNHIRVSDNGQGFDLEKVGDKLFGLNQRFHNHSDSKGVGLYLVYNHVTSLGGQIDISSAVNQGTTFTISLKE